MAIFTREDLSTGNYMELASLYAILEIMFLGTSFLEKIMATVPLTSKILGYTLGSIHGE